MKREASWQNYTYEKSLDCFKDEEKFFISNYLYVGDNSDKASKAEFVKDIKQFAKAAKELISIGKNFEPKQNQTDGQIAAKIKDSLERFDAIDLWKKESNKSVVAFKDTYKNYLKLNEDTSKKDSDNTDDQLVDYALTVFMVEHDRWTRLHVSDGWVYGAKCPIKKHHDCMADTRHIDDKGSFVYDFMNAVWAVAELIENK